jgi:hypothetical protein
MSYTSYDFYESVSGAAEFTSEDVAECLAAWGETGDDSLEWKGGFVLRLKDGRYAYLTGWCDTSGWGCQDDIEVVLQDHPFDLNALDADVKWDDAPVDLNRYIRGEIENFC